MSGPSVNPPRGTPSLVPESTSRGPTCILFVDDRVILRASAPPDAEYALFDVDEIELRSSEPGRVREHGFTTTAGMAKERLRALGLTRDVVASVTATFQPDLALAYARGFAVRKITKVLGGAELLATDAYDADARAYRGVYLDLGVLAADLRRPHAGAELQAVHLATVLDGVRDDAKVVLSTDAWTKTRRAGERTHKRPTLGGVATLCDALFAHARGGPTPALGAPLPREDVVALLRTKADATDDEDERAMYLALQSAVTERTQPERGPLANATLWAIERRMDAGDFAAVVDDIERLERTSGRSPGTTYLRGRASLLLRLEPAKVVAERVSALALSLTSFQELSLLAAEAWLDAGEPRRAMPFARDLVDAPVLEDGLRMRAQRVMARVVGAAPPRAPAAATPEPSPRPPSTAPSAPSAPPPPRPVAYSVPDPHGTSAFEPAPSRVPTVRGTPPGGIEAVDPAPRTDTSPGIGAVVAPAPASSRAPAPRTPSSRAPAAPSSRAPAAPREAPRAGTGEGVPRRPTSAPAAAPSRPPALELDLPPPPAASFTLDLPDPGAGAPLDRASAPPRPRLSMARIETFAPKSNDPRAEPDDAPSVVVPVLPAPPRLDSVGFAAAVTPVRGTASPRMSPVPAPPDASRPAAQVDRVPGASHPAFEVDASPPRARSTIARTGRDELAEHLSDPDPESAVPVVLDGRPSTFAEARTLMTRLARELGLDYRLERGVTLHADIRGIEAMQAHLLDTFPDHVLRTEADELLVRRHGALFSEILARQLGAEWTDISPEHVGDWVMHVPPDARVWPFGRIARLIAMGHRERDLVSTFLELQARSAARP